MADDKTKMHPPAAKPQATESTSPPAPKEKELNDLLARARQTVKPIVNSEAANEIVSDDLLNFRMK